METRTNGTRNDIERVYDAIGAIHAGLLTLLEIVGNKEAYLEGLLKARSQSLGESLTGAEMKVAIAVARRIPRADITAERGVALKTLEKQISAAMQKLGFDDCRAFQGWIQGVMWQTDRIVGRAESPRNVGGTQADSPKP